MPLLFSPNNLPLWPISELPPHGRRPLFRPPCLQKPRPKNLLSLCDATEGVESQLLRKDPEAGIATSIRDISWQQPICFQCTCCLSLSVSISLCVCIPCAEFIPVWNRNRLCWSINLFFFLWNPTFSVKTLAKFLKKNRKTDFPFECSRAILGYRHPCLILWSSILFAC